MGFCEQIDRLEGLACISLDQRLIFASECLADFNLGFVLDKFSTSQKMRSQLSVVIDNPWRLTSGG